MNDDPLRIAVISPVWFPVPPTGYGGIEWIVWLLADGLVDAGHDVTLFASGDSHTKAKLASVYAHAPSAMIGNTLPELHHCLACYERADEFDVINDHSGLPAALIGGLIDNPVLHTIHGPLDGQGGVIYEQIARVAPKIGFISISMNQRKPKPHFPWVANCPNALDFSLYPVKPHRGDYLLFLGRMSPDKGCHRAIDVAVTAGLPLKIAGKNREPLERQYFDEFVAPHLSDQIQYMGEVTHGEKVELLQNARATLFPIEWEEPFGLVMIESMACGTPVIATRWGAVPEVIENTRSGIIVDDYRNMAAAIEEADRLDPLELVRFAQERFSPERMVADYLRAFRSVVARPDPPAATLERRGSTIPKWSAPPAARPTPIRPLLSRLRKPAVWRPTSGREEERRVVSVLFVDLVGFTARAEKLDPEDVRAILAPYHESVRREIESFGGVVEKFIGDAVMAVFGAPTAYGDDSERAMRAALAVRETVREMNERDEDLDLQLRIAVNTGEALVSLKSRPELGESMIAGDVVNTAARLQAAAPVNGILVGEETHAATHGVIAYEPGAACDRQGEGGAASRLDRCCAPLYRRASVACRCFRSSAAGHELETLRWIWQRTIEERRPHLVTILGEAGVGKTRLAVEFAADRLRTRRPDRPWTLAALPRQQRLRGLRGAAQAAHRDLRERLARTSRWRNCGSAAETAVGTEWRDGRPAPLDRARARPGRVRSGPGDALLLDPRLPRGGRNRAPDRPRLRGPALGRPEPARPRRDAERAPARRPDPGARARAARAARRSPVLGRRAPVLHGAAAPAARRRTRRASSRSSCSSSWTSTIVSSGPRSSPPLRTGIRSSSSSSPRPRGSPRPSPAPYRRRSAVSSRRAWTPCRRRSERCWSTPQCRGRSSGRAASSASPTPASACPSCSRTSSAAT